MRKFKNYKDAKNFVGSLKFKSMSDYKKYKNLPQDIPKDAQKIYKKEWESWPVYLNSNFILRKKWRTYTAVKKYIKKLKLNSIKDYRKLFKTKNLPIDFPASPSAVYKSKFEGWSIFLGTGKKPRSRKN